MKDQIIKRYVKLLNIYWEKNDHLIYQFLLKNFKKNKIISKDKNKDPTPVAVDLHKYSEKAFKKVLIPKFLNTNSLDKVDWARCIEFLYNIENVEGFSENLFSYSKKIDKKYLPYLNKAWLNRYAILIRKIIAKKKNIPEQSLFGNRPKAKCILTHDIDVTKFTFNFFTKQFIFIIFNSLKFFFKFKLKRSFQEISRLYYLIKEKSYTKYIKTIIETEKTIKCEKIFFINSNINASKKFFSFNNLINPNYELRELSFLKENNNLSNFKIGIHPTIQTYNSQILMKKELKHLESFFNLKIIYSRQHWLKYKKNRTSSVLKKCGILNDFTFGFNDISCFRGSRAFLFKDRGINRIPMVMMDSHLYDYSQMEFDQIKKSINKILDEVILVGGTISINWHPHTISKSFGWKKGYDHLIKKIKKNEKYIY